MKKVIFGLLIFTLALSGIASNRIPDVLVAKQFLQNKGFEIISYLGDKRTIVLTKKAVIYSNYWALQKVDPAKYIGKPVTQMLFTVKNHPLDNWVQKDRWGNIIQKSNGVGVMVFLVNDQVVGGLSGPMLDDPLMGGAWSLDGETFEEVHPEVKKIGYEKWGINWQNRFK